MLTGKIVKLRPIESEDVEKLRLMGNAQSVVRKTVRQFLVGKEEMILWQSNLCKNRDALYLAISDRNCLYGVIGLRFIDWVNRKGELTMFIDPPSQGFGYGREALTLFCDYCFDTLNLHKIFLNVLESNRTAIRAYEKVGFYTEGRLVDEVYVDGKYNSMKRMAKLK